MIFLTSSNFISLPQTIEMCEQYVNVCFVVVVIDNETQKLID